MHFSNKYEIGRGTEKIFHQQGIVPTRYFSTPTPLNNWLWYIVAEDKEGYHIGYRSVFDSKDSISFHYFPRNDSLLISLHDQNELKKLLRFSKGYYTAGHQKDTLVFNDLRFGQIIGWQEDKGKFVFHYFLMQPNSNKLVVQRGRFEKWDWEVLKNLYQRIKGI